MINPDQAAFGNGLGIVLLLILGVWKLVEILFWLFQHITWQ